MATCASCSAFVGVGGERVRRRPGRRPAHLDQHEHVGHPVLERLEGADRPAELDPLLAVVDRHLQGPGRQAGLERGHADGPDQLGAGPRGGAVADPGAARASRRARRMVWSIDGSQSAWLDAGSSSSRSSSRTASRTVAWSANSAGPSSRAIVATSPGRDPGEQPLLGVLVGAGEQRLRWRPARPAGGRGPASGRAPPARPSTRTARTRRRRTPPGSASAATPICSQSSLPQRLVVAGLGLRGRADRGAVGALGQQRANGGGELLLLLAEPELHQRTPSLGAAAPVARPGCPTRRRGRGSWSARCSGRTRRCSRSRRAPGGRCGRRGTPRRLHATLAADTARSRPARRRRPAAGRSRARSGRRPARA